MADQDTIWKEIIAGYFKEFLAFFHLKAHDDIDWSKRLEFLDKELAQIAPDSKIGTRLADKLVKVFRLDGNEIWVLIHLEVQGYYDATFSERMYVYNNRIFDLYRRQVVSLVIFTDESSSFRPNFFGYSLWDTHLAFSYRTIKLLDYRDEWEALEKDLNPFSIVVMAHLKMRELGLVAVDELAVWKLKLTKQLYQRGYTKQWIIGFYRAIDWLVKLPKELEESVWRELVEYERQEVGMPYITTGERIGIEKGTLNMALRQLKHKFGLLEPETEQAIKELDLEQLEELSEALLDFKDKSQIAQWLSEHRQN